VCTPGPSSRTSPVNDAVTVSDFTVGDNAIAALSRAIQFASFVTVRRLDASEAFADTVKVSADGSVRQPAGAVTVSDASPAGGVTVHGRPALITKTLCGRFARDTVTVFRAASKIASGTGWKAPFSVSAR